MTREEFIQVSEKKGYRYLIEGETLIVDYKGDVSFNALKSLPSGVEFKNGGYVRLNSLKSLPADVQFNNGGIVSLPSLTSLPADVQFRNRGYVWLDSLTSLPADAQFNNSGYVSLRSLKSFNLEDLDYTFQNSGPIYIEGLNMQKIEFPESRWVPVKTRRVKTFESFSYGL